MNKEVIDSLHTLRDLSGALNSSLNTDEVVAMLLENMTGIMGAERALVLILDKRKSALTIEGAYGFEEGELWVKWFRNVRSFERCIVRRGTVITLKEIIPEDDYRELIYVMPMLAEMSFAPLEINGEAYGLIGVMRLREMFSQVEIELLRALGSQSAVAMNNAKVYGALRNTFLKTTEAIAEAVNSRDPYTGGHTRRVVEYSLTIADALGLSAGEKETLKLAALLHDIGKIGIDDSILGKGGDLSEEEELKMREHPAIGAHMLGIVEEMRDVIPGVFHHHEWFDGSGYPEGLKGEDIPLEARIIAVTDAYDALTTDRPYRKAMYDDEALEELACDSGTHFDPSLVDIFHGILIEERGRGV